MKTDVTINNPSEKTPSMMRRILFTLQQATSDLEYRDLCLRVTSKRSGTAQFDVALSRLQDNNKIDYYISYNKYGKGFPYWYVVSDSRPKTDHSKETLENINWNN